MVNVFPTYSEMVGCSLAKPVSFCIETGSFHVWNGTAWIKFINETAVQTMIPAPLYARVTGSNVTRTAQTLADITGLSVPLLANSVYEFAAVLSVASSSTAGNGYGVNFSAAGATIEAQISGTLAAATQKTMRISALNTAASPFVIVAGNGGILIRGIVTTGANAGNLTVSHLKVTSGTSSVFINSFLKATKI